LLQYRAFYSNLHIIVGLHVFVTRVYFWASRMIG
jgi:hypothetical protein